MRVCSMCACMDVYTVVSVSVCMFVVSVSVCLFVVSVSVCMFVGSVSVCMFVVRVSVCDVCGICIGVCVCLNVCECDFVTNTDLKSASKHSPVNTSQSTAPVINPPGKHPQINSPPVAGPSCRACRKTSTE